MPAMYFDVRWPDQEETRCYSPSLVIQDYLQPGTDYVLNNFLHKVREALNLASERVRAKYGFACSHAMDQLAEIEQLAARFSPDQSITVTRFAQ